MNKLDVDIRDVDGVERDEVTEEREQEIGGR